MDRTAAVARVAEGLGFRPDLDAIIVLRLQEAQRDLEKGKTLPRFLLQEDQPLELVEGQHSYQLPEGFLRETDYEPLRFAGDSVSRATRLRRERLVDAFDVLARGTLAPRVPGVPRVYVLRNKTVEFWPAPSNAISLVWSYYRADEVLASNIENQWLREGSDWLIGEAGYRLAMSLRDGEAVALFNDLRTRGRLAVLADDVAREFSGGAYVLGAVN